RMDRGRANLGNRRTEGEPCRYGSGHSDYSLFELFNPQQQTAVLSKKIDEGPGKTRATEQRHQLYRTSRATSLWHPVEQKCDAFASSCFFWPHDEEGESSKTNV